MWNDGNQPKQGSRLASDDSARPTNLDSRADGRAAAGQHINEHLGTELVDMLSEEIAHAGLNHTKCFGYGPLCRATRHDECLNSNYEVRPNRQRFGLVTVKAPHL